MAKYICMGCGRKYENWQNFCTNCGCMLKKATPGKGFAIAGLVIGILSCFYAFVYTLYFGTLSLVAKIQPYIYQEHYANEWFMKYSSFVLIIVAAAISITLSFIAVKKGNVSKITSVSRIISLIALSIGVFIFILLNI